MSHNRLAPKHDRSLEGQNAPNREILRGASFTRVFACCIEHHSSSDRVNDVTEDVIANDENSPFLETKLLIMKTDVVLTNAGPYYDGRSHPPCRPEVHASKASTLKPSCATSY